MLTNAILWGLFLRSEILGFLMGGVYPPDAFLCLVIIRGCFLLFDLERLPIVFLSLEQKRKELLARGAALKKPHPPPHSSIIWQSFSLGAKLSEVLTGYGIMERYGMRMELL